MNDSIEHIRFQFHETINKRDKGQL